jgi:hypothetical protein
MMLGTFGSLVLTMPAVAAELRIDTGHAGTGDNGAVKDVDGTLLNGPDARQQLVVTAAGDDGALRDVTHAAKYSVAPEGIVEVDATGMVVPKADGAVTITAALPDGPSAAAKLVVKNFNAAETISFPKQIVPIFTKLGCNSGGCHGKSEGQNGFRLSLLGFEPDEDYEHLVKEARGRRLFPAAPDESLLLLKPIGAMPHGGGKMIERDSHVYRLLRRWIAQGLPPGSEDDPTVTRIEVFPVERTMKKDQSQQLVVVAHYSDGSTEDVTRMAQFEANSTEMAETTPSGLVKILGGVGDVAIMIRYQSQVAVFRAMVPLGAPVENLPEPRNFIDKLVYEKLEALGMPPSAPCDDASFIRRTCLDIAGRLPTLEETEAFLADKSVNKRDAWIDTLLAGTDYADFFANKWSSLLRNRRSQGHYTHGTYAFHDWIRESLHENKPYDTFVRDILTASGDISRNPPVAWYRQVRDTTTQLEDSAQLFLGVRLQCARCHHHPFEKWSQDDYYGFAAFFSRVGRKAGSRPGDEIVFHNRGAAQTQNPKTKNQLKPTGLGAEPAGLTVDQDPRQALAAWMSDKDNDYFAKVLVNRYWKHFFGRALVEPEDDLRATNPATNPKLLDGLAEHFIKSGFDLKGLVRTMCRSQVYQFSSLPNEHNAGDTQSFSRHYPQRLQAEVLLDAIDQVTNAQTQFAGLPAGTRAVQLPDDSFNQNSYFLRVFGRPEMKSSCECERSQDASLAQSLHLLNSKDVQNKLTGDAHRSAILAADAKREHDAKIRELYLRAFSRVPNPEEIALAAGHIAKKEKEVEESNQKKEEKDKAKPGTGTRQAYEDIVWALINSKEFLFNH